ncbi:hemolysin III family channel protein [Clostridium thermobutyricum]|uniref:Hemolysin III family channel protein n=1 Tax=Clostridium thermobutyricum TaxID=29372 RepID=N9WC61_9CLOT|nr:hemolysin III family protein [Clostridium thermobutyricum]ENZ00465.1 hemolysin III family channel protein [Clostridium thermobutyricum]
MEKYLREPVNGLTHLTGAILSFIGLIALLTKAFLTDGSAIEVFSVFLFGISMILLYSASATYHSVISSKEVLYKLKKLDHSMIFVLIAGSYAPFCLISLNNNTGFLLFGAVLISGLLGIIFKLFWVTCPKWISSVMYIAIGWFAVFAIYPLSQVLHENAFFLLVLGGILYTIGGIIYAFKNDRIKIGVFGTHEIFHIFIMLGSLSHFISVFAYLL